MQTTFLNQLASRYAAQADAEIAAGQSAYLKHQFSFIGLKTPTRRAIDKAFLKEMGPPPIDSLKAIVKDAYERPERDYQLLAVDLVDKQVKKLDASFMDLAHHMIVNKSWWDTVDMVASHLVGGLVLKHPFLVEKVDEWITDDNMWLRRTAIIHQLLFKTKTDEKRLFAYCEQQLHESEFFIRKAIGWALRQYAKTAPEPVRDFVATHPEMSHLSRREALKHLGEN